MRSLLLAWGCTAVLVPLARAVAVRAGIVDRPTGGKAHRAPTPLLGGVAIFGGILAAALAGASPKDMPAVVAGAVLVAVGAWDDLRGVPPWVRLLLEFLVALALCQATRTQLWFPPGLPVLGARAVTSLWLVVVLNAVNCMDCADGSLAGSGVLVALGTAAVGAVAGSEGPGLALAVAGALLGFLVFNRPPARIFMGDAGSLPVGLLLGWLGVRAASGTPAAFSIAALLLVSVPVFDFLAVHVRRLWRGRDGLWVLLSSRGCDHLPHRLAGRARSPWGGLGWLYLAHLGSGLAAVASSSSGSPWPGLGVLFVWVSLLLWLDLWLPGEDASPLSAEDRPLARSRLPG